jgi:urea-proton symporter
MAGFDAPTGPTASPLGQGWGYGIVLGVGFLFALGMVSPLMVINFT